MTLQEAAAVERERNAFPPPGGRGGGMGTVSASSIPLRFSGELISRLVDDGSITLE